VVLLPSSYLALAAIFGYFGGIFMERAVKILGMDEEDTAGAAAKSLVSCVVLV